MIHAADARNLPGAPVLDVAGDKIGTVAQVFLDRDNDKPTWVTVHTGLFGRLESFVPLEEATFDGEEIRVAVEKSLVKDAPKVDADSALTPEEEAGLFVHYGLAYGTAEVTTPEAAGISDADIAREQAEAQRENAERDDEVAREQIDAEREDAARDEAARREVARQDEAPRAAHRADAPVDAAVGASATEPATTTASIPAEPESTRLRRWE
jgi:hypothetical protein